MNQIDAIEKLAVRSSWDAWFETYGVIEDAEGNIRGMEQDELLVANYLQTLYTDVFNWCNKNKVPVRMLGLKPRQRGSSTYTVAGLYQEINKRRISSAIIGAKLKQAKNLYKMCKLYNQHDRFDWGTNRSFGAESAIISHAKGRESTVELLSAEAIDPGRSGTYQFLLATEVARWSEDGVSNAAEILSGLLKGVQVKAGTTVILETTARGASGDFYDRWKDAYDFEDFKRRFEQGQLMDGEYIRIFAPWYKFPELSLELTPEQKDEANRTLGKVTRYNSKHFGNEQAIMERFALTLGQVAWRRLAIDKECEKSPEIFEQDYPSTWETAFLTSGDLRFNASGMEAMRKIAKANPPTCGILEKQLRDSYRVAWKETSEDEAIIYRWEEPRPGYRYLISADVMTGADQTQGDDPDRHSVWVIKAGGWEAGGWRRPLTVARIKPPCRYDIDMLGDWIVRLHRYYRGALICPEMNNPGLALITYLKPLGVPIYHREVFDEFEKRFEKKLGWQTTSKTKPMLIENLARAIREYDVEGEGMDILCEHALDECMSFVRKNGKDEAMDGKKDDDVMALGIGLTLIENAVVYHNIVERRLLPRDLAIQANSHSSSGLGQYS